MFFGFRRELIMMEGGFDCVLLGESVGSVGCSNFF